MRLWRKFLWKRRQIKSTNCSRYSKTAGETQRSLLLHLSREVGLLKKKTDFFSLHRLYPLWAEQWCVFQKKKGRGRRSKIRPAAFGSAMGRRRVSTRANCTPPTLLPTVRPGADTWPHGTGPGERGGRRRWAGGERECERGRVP